MSEETAVIVVNRNLPAMTIQEAITRRNSIVEFVKAVMVVNTDYGVIPGTAKPTLLKPGAEKLVTLFGLMPRFSITEKIMEWGGDDTEPLFYFAYKCQLWRGDMIFAEGEGSCNSHEKKYRWRSSERACPVCGKPCIRKSKQDDGFYCWAKLGGCGATFRGNDPAITGQQLGQVVNPDIADQVNTIQKMAQKRALIAATLIAVNASEFFTQDMEDLQPIDADYTVTRSTDQPKPAQKKAMSNSPAWPPSDMPDFPPLDLPPTAQVEPSAPPKSAPKASGVPVKMASTKFTQQTVAEWNAAVTAFVADNPNWQTKAGKPDMAHIQASAARCGFDHIDGDNRAEVFHMIKATHEAKAADAEVLTPEP